MASHRTISLPSVLVEEIESIVENKRYSSIAEFVKEAIRLRLEELNTRVHPGEDGQEEAEAHVQV